MLPDTLVREASMMLNPAVLNPYRKNCTIRSLSQQVRKSDLRIAGPDLHHLVLQGDITG